MAAPPAASDPHSRKKAEIRHISSREGRRTPIAPSKNGRKPPQASA
ncbi:hypothetical protein LDL36_05805 [Komagataeibacter sp. FNDCR1]|nr:hypothetical protein [Komagataeibacter sp. FNDCR1]